MSVTCTGIPPEPHAKLTVGQGLALGLGVSGLLWVGIVFGVVEAIRAIF